MEDRTDYLRLIPVTPFIYEQLNEMWAYELFDFVDHTPQQAIAAARQLNFNRAACWIQDNPEDYQFGQYYGHWRLAGKFDGNVVCQRFKVTYGPSALTNVPRSVVHHSPSGHEWGYGGSGPADLALDILNFFLPSNDQNGSTQCWCSTSSRIAYQLHQNFKQDIIAQIPKEGATTSKEAIIKWIEGAIASR